MDVKGLGYAPTCVKLVNLVKQKTLVKLESLVVLANLVKLESLVVLANLVKLVMVAIVLIIVIVWSKGSVKVAVGIPDGSY